MLQPQRPVIRLWLCGLAAAAVFPGDAAGQEAQSPFAIAGSIRVKGEVIDGQFRASGPESDALIGLQTIVRLTYDAGSVTLGGELIDARSYGQVRGSSVGTSENNALEPVEAWARIDLGGSFGGKSVALTAGRFTLDLGSGRLAGRAADVGSPNSFAGARLDWAGRAGEAITAFWTMPFDRTPVGDLAVDRHGIEFDRATTDRQFFGLFAARPKVIGGAGVEAYAMRLVERDAPDHATRDRRLTTLGARVLRKPAKGKVDYELEGAYQLGTTSASAAASAMRGVDVRAGMLRAGAGWTFVADWQPRLAAVFDYASGDTRSASRYTRFDTLYGKRRGDFGPVGLYGPVSFANLVSAGLAFDARPAKNLDVMVKARALWLATESDSFATTGIHDSSGRAGRGAGTQVEAKLRTWLVPKRLELEAGGAWLAKGRFLREAPNVRYRGDTRYGYLQLIAGF